MLTLPPCSGCSTSVCVYNVMCVYVYVWSVCLCLYTCLCVCAIALYTAAVLDANDGALYVQASIQASAFTGVTFRYNGSDCHVRHHTEMHMSISIYMGGARVMERVKEGDYIGIIRLMRSVDDALLTPASSLWVSLCWCRWRARRVGVAV